MFRTSRIALALIVPVMAAPVLSAATVPRQAPPFTVQMPNNGKTPLSTYKGKVVVIAFILTDCSHCQSFTLLLTRLQNEFGAQGMQAIESAVQERPEPAIPGFVSTYKPTFPVGFNKYEDALDFLQHPKATSLHTPGIAVIDRKGMIVAQYQASDAFMADAQVEQNLRGLIRKLVAEPAAGGKGAGKKK